ncbi:sigma factor [Arthrobacter sp. M4]|uniref:sigma factor n=1 Tax=Arthrobacter sp. M4 TaxID=218160 RepID=UPI001CDC22E6|nr:sigma factor [Arthrobacter sp. M4]MCA4132651.1 hypothetical protein [Arthrobacter sp. M4]
MTAVDGVHRYVISRLARIGRSCDVDDVMQDIRFAVWDGVAKGRYHRIPGVSFGAWVQGVCGNVCAAYIRREFSHQTLPLLVEATTSDVEPVTDTLAVLCLDRDLDRSPEKLVDQAWAQTMLGMVHRSVNEETWRLATASLTAPRRYGPPSPQDRRRWHAVTVVRQTAKTINAALNCEPGSVSDVDSLCRCAANCLPTTILRRVADTIVRPGLRGPERAAQLGALAVELGVTERYVAVNIGFARQLYRTAWRVLQSGAGSLV